MERESKEEDGLSTCSLLLKEEVSNCGNHGDSASSSDSSVKALFVFSTLVAVCGALATGCTVSIGAAPTTLCIPKQFMSHPLCLYGVFVFSVTFLLFIVTKKLSVGLQFKDRSYPPVLSNS